MIDGLIEKLIAYAKAHLYLQEADEMFVRNRLFSALKLKGENVKLKCDIEQVRDLDVVDSILQPIFDYAVKNGVCNLEDNDIFTTYIMGIVTPLPSVISDRFERIENQNGSKRACDYFFDLCVKSNYIKKTNIARNIKWRAQFENNYLEITINLSKPEKSNADIKRQKEAVAVNYPSCHLCEENIGYEGRYDFPARETLRFIPVELDGEQWYMQYSPYMYYDEHCIVFNKKHTPMFVNGQTIKKLADFTDRFPHYFVGSNASLPIVGGSILAHEHFQGGEHLMPLHFAKSKKSIKTVKYTSVKADILDWLNSTIQLVSRDKSSLISLASDIIEVWKNYSDESVSILAHTTEQHNAITPILRKVGEEYVLHLILRNNRCNEQYPNGIFHVHNERMNIKSEAIGLIEAMGLFILPPRLKTELNELADLWVNSNVITKGSALEKHSRMLESLKDKYGLKVTKAQAQSAIEQWVNDTCYDILNDTAVFKNDVKGAKAFDKFISSIQF